MAIDITSIQTFSDSDLLVLWRNALAAVSFGKAYTINGRSMTKEDLPEIRNTITWLEQRIQDDANMNSGEGGNVSVVTFDDPT